MSKSNNVKYWWYTIILFTTAVIILILWVLFVVNWSWIEIADSNNEIGDAIGGITNPIIGIGGIILTFLAFYIQYQFNIVQSKVILEQKKENNFNFLLSEFTRLEIKIDEASNLGENFNQVIIGEYTVNKKLLKRNLNKISYAIIYFNNLMAIIDIDRLMLESKVGWIDNKDKIILTNLNSIYSIIFKDSLENVRSILNHIIEKGFTTQAEYNIIEFESEYKNLESSIQKIKDILFINNPPFKIQYD